MVSDSVPSVVMDLAVLTEEDPQMQENIHIYILAIALKTTDSVGLLEPVDIQYLCQKQTSTSYVHHMS